MNDCTCRLVWQCSRAITQLALAGLDLLLSTALVAPAPLEDALPFGLHLPLSLNPLLGCV